METGIKSFFFGTIIQWTELYALSLCCLCLCAAAWNIIRCNIENVVDSFETPKTIESLDFPYGFGNIFAFSSQYSFIFSNPFLRNTVYPPSAPTLPYTFFLTHFISWPHLLFYDCFYSYIQHKHKHTYVLDGWFVLNIYIKPYVYK